MHARTLALFGFPSTDVFPLLPHLADVPLAAVIATDEAGQKRLYPIDRRVEPTTLLPGHLAGALPPTLVACANGNQWTERNARALATGFIDSEDRCSLLAFDPDCRSASHPKCPTPPEVAHEAADRIAGLLTGAGLETIVAVSGGGEGRHVWGLLPCSIPADAAVWAATTIAKKVRAGLPTATVDLRPESINGGGGWLILPVGGWAPSQGGGRVLVHHPPGLHPIAAVDHLLSAFGDADRHAKARAKEAAQTKAVNHALYNTTNGHRGVESRDVNLRAVAETIGEVVRHQGAEIHVRCQHCPGTVKVHPDKRVWRCFQCGVGGGSDPAAYLLVEWLLPNSSPREVFAALAYCVNGEVAHV